TSQDSAFFSPRPVFLLCCAQLLVVGSLRISSSIEADLLPDSWVYIQGRSCSSRSRRLAFFVVFFIGFGIFRHVPRILHARKITKQSKFPSLVVLILCSHLVVHLGVCILSPFLVFQHIGVKKTQKRSVLVYVLVFLIFLRSVTTLNPVLIAVYWFCVGLC